MRIDLAADLFDNESADALIFILRIVECLTEGRHSWRADVLTVESAKVYFEAHAPTLASSIYELGRKSIVDGIWASPPEKSTAKVSIDNLSLISTDLCMPAVLVVEDFVNDGYFIDSIVDVFGASRVREALDKGWLVVRHSGGSRLEQVAVSEVEKFKVLKRVVALLDSDRLNPGARTSSHLKQEAMRQVGVIVHVLEMREAENYVPNRVLAFTDNRTATSAKLTYLKKFTPDQRAYFDIKKGFASRGGAAVHADQADLYKGIRPAAIAALSDGFGTKVLQVLHQNRTSLTVQDFAKIDSSVVIELERLLQAIESVI